MSAIRLINASTRLPVDAAIEDSFFSILDARFGSAVLASNADEHVDVLMVMRDDPDLLKGSADEDSVDVDWAGIYIPHAKAVHRPLIKLSPERVLDLAARIHSKAGKRRSLKSLFLTVFNVVIVHDLAHALMDGRLLAKACPKRDWRKDVDWREENARLIETPGPARTGADSFEHDPVLEAEMRAHQRLRDAAQDNNCELHNRPIPGHLRQLRKTVEESLANGFVLKQDWNSAQRRIIRDFLAVQAYEYRLGLKWSGTLEQTLDTGRSWAEYKRNAIGIAAAFWKQADRAQQRVLEDLVERLARPAEKIKFYDFSGVNARAGVRRASRSTGPASRA